MIMCTRPVLYSFISDLLVLAEHVSFVKSFINLQYGEFGQHLIDKELGNIFNVYLHDKLFILPKGVRSMALHQPHKDQ